MVQEAAGIHSVHSTSGTTGGSSTSYKSFNWLDGLKDKDVFAFGKKHIGGHVPLDPLQAALNGAAYRP